MNFNKFNIPSQPSPLGASSNSGRQARPHPLRPLFSLYSLMNPTLCAHGNRKPSSAAALQFDPKGYKVPRVLFHRNNGRATHFNAEARFRSCELVLNIHEREYVANIRRKILGSSGRRKQPQQIQPPIVPTSIWIHPPQPAQPAPPPTAPPAPRPNPLRRQNAGYGLSINGEVHWGLERPPSPPAFSPPPSANSALSDRFDPTINAGDLWSDPSTSEVDQESDTIFRTPSPPSRPLRREGAQIWYEDPIPEPTLRPSRRENAVVLSDYAVASASGSTSATTRIRSSPQASGSLEPRTPSTSTLRTYIDEDSGLEYVDDPFLPAPQAPVAESSAWVVEGPLATDSPTTIGGSNGNSADDSTGGDAPTSSPSRHRGHKRSRDSDAESQDEDETARPRRRARSVEPTTEMEVDVSAAPATTPSLSRRSTRTQVMNKVQGIYRDVKARFKI